jgi:hypothetical protein
VSGSGTDADPYRGWETQLTGSRVVYHFPAGVYEFDRVRVAGTAVRLVGDGPHATTLRGRRGDGVAIQLSGQLDGIESMDVGTRGDVPLGPDHVLLHTANFPEGGNQFRLSHLRLYGFRDGLLATGDALVDDVRLFAATPGGIGVHLLDPVSVTLTNVVVVVSADVRAGIVVEGAARIPDTVHFKDVHVGYHGGTAWTALAVLARSESTAPEWMKVVNSTFEAPNDPHQPNPFPAVLLAAGRSVYLSNTYVLGGRDGVAIGEEGRFLGPADVKLESCIIIKSLRNGVRHDAAAPTQVVNSTVFDNSQEADARHAGVFLGAHSREFSMIGGRLGNGIVLGVQAGQGYGIETAPGADRFAFSGVHYEGNRIGNVRGGVCPPLQSAAVLRPTCPLHHVVGVAPISTIVPPSFDGSLTLIADGDLRLRGDGNIATPAHAARGGVVVLTYEPREGRWFH